MTINIEQLQEEYKNEFTEDENTGAGREFKRRELEPETWRAIDKKLTKIIER